MHLLTYASTNAHIHIHSSQICEDVFVRHREQRVADELQRGALPEQRLNQRCVSWGSYGAAVPVCRQLFCE